MPSWRLWLGLGTIPELDSEQVSHPRCVLVPSISPALQAITTGPWSTKEGNVHENLRLSLQKNKYPHHSWFPVVGSSSFLFLFFLLVIIKGSRCYLSIKGHLCPFNKNTHYKILRNYMACHSSVMETFFHNVGYDHCIKPYDYTVFNYDLTFQ